MEEKMKLLLRPEEAAQALGLGRSMIYKLVNSGELAHVKIGAAVRVPVQTVIDYVETHTVGGKVRE